MRPEVASTKLSPARQHSTHVMFHLRFTVIIFFCAQILPLMRHYISRNDKLIGENRLRKQRLRRGVVFIKRQMTEMGVYRGKKKKRLVP
jgi:hypothetical protein